MPREAHFWCGGLSPASELEGRKSDMRKREKLKISQQEITRAFLSGDWATRYPPLLSIDQAAELLQVPKATIYQWRSEGRLTGCVQRVGKHLRFFRDRLALRVMNQGV